MTEHDAFAAMFAPERPPTDATGKAIPWKVLLVDDEADVHAVLHLALQDVEIEGQPLTLLDAHSNDEARERLADHPDISLVLLDVVMETERAGLDLVRHIRRNPANRAIQIIIVTGQPGYAPQREVVTEYQIDGYRLKAELTADKIFFSVCSALRTSRTMRELEKWKQIVDHAEFGISTSSADGTCTEMANQAFARLHGYSPEEMIGRPISELHAIEERSNIQDQIDEARQKGHYTFQSLRMRKDGTTFPAIVDVTAVKDDSGTVQYRIINVKDISDIIAREKQISDRTAQMNFVLTGSDLGFWDWNIETSVVERNARWAEMLGYRLDEIEFTVKQWKDFVHPDDLKLATRSIADHLSGKTPHHKAEYRMIAKDGSYRWILDHAKIVARTTDGRPLRMSGTHTDITDDKERNKFARLAEFSINRAADSLYWLLPDGRIFYVNDAACTSLGYQRDDFIGHTVGDFDQNYSQQVWPDHWRELKEKKSVRLQTTQRRRDGTLMPAEVIANFIEFEGEEYNCAFSRDITDRVKSEEQLQHYAADLKNSNIELGMMAQKAEEANRAKSSFVAKMSHELRTPMNAIIGMLYLMRQTNLSERQAECCDTIHVAANSLVSIINNILDFSKIESGHLTIEKAPFNLDALIENIVSVIGEGVRNKDLELVIEKTKDVPDTLMGDSLRLGQVLQNLIGNAIKFTDAPGEIVVNISTVIAASDQTILRFDIRDTGIGMSNDQLSRLFIAFTQADNSISRRYGGSGLGLTISRQLVELMGGSLDVRSEEGKGTRCSFTLEFDLAAAQSTAPPVALRAHGALRALVVDDHPIARRCLCDMLETFGLTATRVGNGAEALEELARTAAAQAPPYDVVLLDGKMPGMDGFQTAAAIKGDARFASLPLVIMTNSRDNHTGPTNPGDVAAVLIKPVTPSKLLDCLDGVLQTARGPRAPATRPPSSDKLSGRSILLVEDNPINRKIAREILVMAGLRVDVSENGEQAVDRLASPGHGYDAVLLDLHMPVMDGYGAARLIRAQPHNRELPIIAMTADAMAHDRKQCLDAGMSEHIGKPIDVDQMFSTLQHCILREEEGGLKARILFESPSASPETNVKPANDPAVLDVQRGLRRVAGQNEVYQELLEDFVSDYAADGRRLAQSLDTGDHKMALYLAHTLKGLAANLAANRLASEAATLEHAIRDWNDRSSKPDPSGLIKAIDELVDHIRGHVRKEYGDK